MTMRRLLAACACLHLVGPLLPSHAFVAVKATLLRREQRGFHHAALFAASATTNRQQQVLQLVSVSLPKPLGIILEEVTEGAAEGVYVKEVTESGSAAAYAEQIVGCTLHTVQGVDVTATDFDGVMERITEAPEDAVDLQFLPSPTQAEQTYDVGTTVTIHVLQKHKPDIFIEAKVGDNLRQVLIDNDFEVYQGMKQKLGNCGGAGQCTFCAMDFLESDGWSERSDYEDQKLAKFPYARLSCLNNIQGPVTIQKTER